MNEFELIQTYFANQPVCRNDIVVGIGDDGAVVSVSPDRETVITTDAFVSGVHFLHGADPVSVGHKALAVNLSDLAAMGADAVCFAMDLIMPEVNQHWISQFCEGMFGLARHHNVQLVGGDVSRGPLAIAITAYGVVPTGQALLRSGARPGDVIFVSGELGDAALALQQQLGKIQLPVEESATIVDRLDRPMPRLSLGMALHGFATAAIDISDGLVSDLGHIAERSNVGARVDLDKIPLSQVYRRQHSVIGLELALTHGDDYELCFTIPPDKVEQFQAIAREQSCAITAIGEISAGTSVSFVDSEGQIVNFRAPGYRHFS